MAKMADFGRLLRPEEALQPILARPVREALLAWLTEIWAGEELAEVGLAPRKKALFDGPPGVGKTTLAHHLAARLGLPMLAVRPETIVDRYLGSTGRNIGALFEAARDAEDPLLLFFDEFDALAVTRDRPETGADEERNAYVNTLLARLEQHDGIVVAATNHGANIDPAIWRRFDMHVTLELPGEEERRRILARYLAPYGLPAAALAGLAEAMATASPALIRQFCEAIKRNIVLGPRLGWDMGRAATIARILGAIQPHPDCGKPRLWSLAQRDPAVAALPWPLPRADGIDEGTPTPADAGNVVLLARAGDGAR